ncbi:MAG TPA: hypothetical protein VK175_13585 [Leadbetterella sp.]|nr:hypothetical protein [Leadbetterella sp.]
MANLSLKNFKKQFADDTKLWAAKCVVRECDEESKGCFVAFVDMGDQSFDVGVVINNKQEIVSTICDCPKGDGLCQHKFALLSHIVGNEKIETPKLVKNKISPVERILSELSHEDLKTWVNNILTKDKALCVEFIQEFNHEEAKLLTQPEVEKKLKELSKAVFGTRKKVETAEFKKAMSLWENYALNHIKVYLKKPTLNIHFEQLDILHKSMTSQVSVLMTKSYTAYYNIQKKIDTQIAQSLNELSVDDFTQAIDILSFYLVTSSGFDSTMLKTVYEVFKKVDDSRKIQITDLVLEQYKKFHTNTKFGDKSFSQVAYMMLDTIQAFDKYGDYLLPISYDNDFNIDLIGKLIERKKFERAIEFCNAIVRNNYYAEYNFPYWAFLKKLYVLTKQPEKSREIKKQMVPFTGNFEDFLEVYEDMEDESEKKSYRVNILTKFRSHSQVGSFTTTDLFCIKLAGYEKNYNKLIEYLVDYRHIQFYMPYLEEMLYQNKKKTFLNIINYFKYTASGLKPELFKAEKECYLPVYQLLCKFFPEDELTFFLRHHLPSHQKISPDSLVYFISKNLI